MSDLTKVVAGATSLVLRFIIIGCTKGKLDHAAPARDLYTSALFKGRRSYAEREVAEGRAAAWFIMSAQHGLIDPDRVTKPYDMTIATQSKNGNLHSLRSSCYSFLSRLVDVYDPAQPVGQKCVRPCDIVLEVHAGAPYVNALRGFSPRDRTEIVHATASLPIGKQLALYKGIPRTEHAGSPWKEGYCWCGAALCSFAHYTCNQGTHRVCAKCKQDEDSFDRLRAESPGINLFRERPELLTQAGCVCCANTAKGETLTCTRCWSDGNPYATSSWTGIFARACCESCSGALPPIALPAERSNSAFRFPLSAVAGSSTYGYPELLDLRLVGYAPDAAPQPIGADGIDDPDRARDRRRADRVSTAVVARGTRAKTPKPMRANRLHRNVYLPTAKALEGLQEAFETSQAPMPTTEAYKALSRQKRARKAARRSGGVQPLLPGFDIEHPVIEKPQLTAQLSLF